MPIFMRYAKLDPGSIVYLVSAWRTQFDYGKPQMTNGQYGITREHQQVPFGLTNTATSNGLWQGPITLTTQELTQCYTKEFDSNK